MEGRGGHGWVPKEGAEVKLTAGGPAVQEAGRLSAEFTRATRWKSDHVAFMATATGAPTPTTFNTRESSPSESSFDTCTCALKRR